VLEKTIYCTYQHQYSGSYYTIPIRCIKKCKKFPCKEFSALDIDAIQSHERVSVFLTGLKLRRTTLHYIFKHKDGKAQEAYPGFDPKNPDWSKMEGVCEVYPVNKILVPELKLVVKPKNSETQAASKPTRKRKKNQAAF
jgi:hypothetical protein